MADLKLAVREKYSYCCGYCGVSEIDVGSELEVDHFQPRSHDGSDEIHNLVYACAGCNRNKASYWPAPDAPQYRHLLHPQEDDLSLHIRTLDTGYLDGLTPRGKFHIEWLHLNRPQLLLYRQRRIAHFQMIELIEQLQTSHQQLKQQVAQQRRQLVEQSRQIRRLQGQDS